MSLKSQLENALKREEKIDESILNSPSAKVKRKLLTTPKSPPLSVKKRCEFVEKTKNVQSTEEILLQDIKNNEFRARPMPKKVFDAYKPVAGNTPSAKKTDFKEFNLSEVKKKQLLTSDELYLQEHGQGFKAMELNPKIFEKKISDLLSEKPVVPKTIPKEFNFQTNQRKRDKKASEKANEESSSQSSKKKKRFAKANAPPQLSTASRSRPVVQNKPPTLFKATPIPDYNKLAAEFEGKQSAVKHILTKPREFKLSTECRMRKSKIMSQLQEEERQKNAIKNDFKATKAPKFNKVMKVKPSVKAPTKGKAPVFQSESRVKRRKEREMKKQMEEEAKELSIQDPTEFECTVKSSPEVRLKREDASEKGLEMNENDSVIFCGSNHK